MSFLSKQVFVSLSKAAQQLNDHHQKQISRYEVRREQGVQEKKRIKLNQQQALRKKQIATQMRLQTLDEINKEIDVAQTIYNDLKAKKLLTTTLERRLDFRFHYLKIYVDNLKRHVP